MNQKLSSTSRREIRDAMQGLAGSVAKTEAEKLAESYGVSWQYIYGMTEDLRQGKRKKRSDAGRRTFELVPGTDVWTAAELVIHDKLDPDLALLTVQTRNNEAKLPTLAHFQKMLREKNLGKEQRKAKKTAFRRWEAEFPGELYQIDVTALKVRWRDEKTRRIMQIEGVDKNHPMMDASKLRVWQIMLVDDHSRFKFLRYFVGRQITSKEMVRFMCLAYSVLGVPHKLYTDQGGEFKGRHKYAEMILNKLPSIAETGGYRHIPHAAGNAQATGKVENAHKWAEKVDRLVGLADTEGQGVTLEMLNDFAQNVCDYYNTQHVHRVTGQTASARWNGTRALMRKLPQDVIESALLSEVLPVRLDESMTVTMETVAYKVPGQLPFVDYVGKKVLVVVPPNIDWIVLTLPNSDGKFEPTNGGEFEIEKVLATADKAGEFKAVAESTAEGLTKQLKATRKEAIKAGKKLAEQTGEIAPVPHLNVVIETPASNISHFPQPERIVTHDEIAAVATIPLQVTGDRRQVSAHSDLSPVTSNSSLPYTGKDMNYWEAVGNYTDRFDGGVAEAKEFLLGLFPNMTGIQPSLDIETAIENRFEQQRPRLQAVS